MRIVHVITAASIGFGSATAAFAASSHGSVSYYTGQSAEFTQIVSGAAHPVQVSERHHKYKQHQKKYRAERKDREPRENREARRERQHGYDHSRLGRDRGDSDLDKALSILGAAAIISNLN